KRTSGMTTGWGQASRPAEDRSATVFDYLARVREARVNVSERDEVETHDAKLVESVQHSYEEAIAKAADLKAGRTTVPTPADLFAPWEDITARLASATHASQLGLEDASSSESRAPRPESRHIPCQPTVE